MRTAVVATLVVAAAVSCSSDGPGTVVVTDPPTGHAAACERFAERLPRTMGRDVRRRDTSPAGPHVAAYGDPPIVIRCGAPASAAYKTGDPLLSVNGVSWFYEERGDVVVWSLPRAFVNVEVTIPAKWTGDRLSYLTDAVKAAQNG